MGTLLMVTEWYLVTFSINHPPNFFSSKILLSQTCVCFGNLQKTSKGCHPSGCRMASLMGDAILPELKKFPERLQKKILKIQNHPLSIAYLLQR
jgi:hypothetical protein